MKIQRTPDDHSSEAVRLAICEPDANVRRNIQARDPDAMVDGYYAEDARVLPPGQGEVEGKGAIREMWRALVTSGMADLVLETGHIQTEGGSGSRDRNLTGDRTPRGTARPMILEGGYAVTFRRQHDGTWRDIVAM